MTIAGIHQLRPRYGQMGVGCKECGPGTVHLINKPCPHSIKAYRLEFEAEQREAARQRMARLREKPNENNDPVRNADVENIEEILAEQPNEDPPPIRTLIYKRMVEGLGLILASPKGRELTDDFLREVFEEFLSKRREILQ